MYRILIHKPCTAKDSFTYYTTTETTTITDEETGEEKPQKTTIVFETDDLEMLSAEYKKLLSVYTTEQVFPVDVLKVELDAIITDETT